MNGQDTSGDSHRGPRRDSSQTLLPPLSWLTWWNPRRTLGARLLWILLPSFVVAGVLYRVVSERVWARTEASVEDWS